LLSSIDIGCHRLFGVIRRDADALEDRELMTRDALDCAGLLAKQNGDVSAPDRKPPGGGEATSAVASAAGEHRYPPPAYVTAKLRSHVLRQAAAGVLHHLISSMCRSSTMIQSTSRI
jgi:hypothetical protein